MNVSSEEIKVVNEAVKDLFKCFEIVFVIQQSPKIGLQLSLLTDIIQNIVVSFLDCTMTELRMEAFRSLSPYLLLDKQAAKEHIITLCAEISNPLSNRFILFNTLFELILRYDAKTFNINKYLDTDEECENVYSVQNILTLLANSIDYDIDDQSFKAVVVEGFCNLLIFDKVNSVNLLAKLLILWFKPVSYETVNLCSNLVKFFTTYSFLFRSSSTMYTKCYVPVLRMMYEYDLVNKCGINLNEVNCTLMNLSQGLMFKNIKHAINAHSELAGYIFDYLLDEDQPYTTILMDTLFKLNIDFESDIGLVKTLGPKLKRVITHFKKKHTKSSLKYLNKLYLKFNPILKNKDSFVNKKDSSTGIKNKTQVLSSNDQEPSHIVKILIDSPQDPDIVVEEQIDIPQDSDPVIDEQIDLTNDSDSVVDEQIDISESPDPVIDDQIYISECPDPVIEEEMNFSVSPDPVIDEQMSFSKSPDPIVASIHTDQSKSNVVHSDLFSQEDNCTSLIFSDDDDLCQKLDVMKRMSEMFKSSFNTKTKEESIAIDSD